MSVHPEWFSPPPWLHVEDDLTSSTVTVRVKGFGMERCFEVFYDTTHTELMQRAFKEYRELRRIHEVTTALEGK